MPTESFDPVEVSTLAPEALEQNVADALAAIAVTTSLDGLKAVATAHDGDRSPLALANREIGALPPAARKAAGQRIGPARGQVKKALAARQVELESERDTRVLVEESVDVTCRRRAARPARGTRSPRRWSASATASWRWAGRSPKAPRPRAPGSTSTR